MKVTILTKSSGTAPYEVDFTVSENALLVFCNCQAGAFGKLCKHKTALLAADASILCSEAELPKLEQINGLVKRASGLSRIASEILESERTVSVEQTKLKNLKKRLETLLTQGAEIDIC